VIRGETSWSKTKNEIDPGTNEVVEEGGRSASKIISKVRRKRQEGLWNTPVSIWYDSREEGSGKMFRVKSCL